MQARGCWKYYKMLSPGYDTTFVVTNSIKYDNHKNPQVNTGIKTFAVDKEQKSKFHVTLKSYRGWIYIEWEYNKYVVDIYTSMFIETLVTRIH